MKKKRFTEEQISYTLGQAESGTPVTKARRRDRDLLNFLIYY